MNETESAVLKALQAHKAAMNSEDLAKATGLNSDTVASALEKLAEQKLVDVQKQERTWLAWSAEASRFEKLGTPERRLFEAVEKKPLSIMEAATIAGLEKQEEGIALQWGRVQGWLKIEKRGAETLVSTQGKPTLTFDAMLALGIDHYNRILSSRNPADVLSIRDDLQKLTLRKFITTNVRKIITATLTPAGAKAKPAAQDDSYSQLTPEMLQTGSWKGKKARPYDVSTAVVPTRSGKVHAYKAFLDDARDKLVGLGFREVTGPLVETEFWNMDALYMAQDHPARDIHDVFHLEHPAIGDVPEKLFTTVKEAHATGGGTGSRGWRYDMSYDISRRLIARSHDTGISARELYKHKNPPDKVFFFAKAFRPDEIDWKHMIEFEQLGGYVADQNLTLRELLGYLEAFAVQVCGAKSVKFQPSYYPFTEPGVDMHANLPGKGWMELGGAGLFRPEMLEPLGVNVPVGAWGIGIGRLALFRLGLNDIRDLYSKDLELLDTKN